MAIHHSNDGALGQPLCADCYDYRGAVLFNWWAPELWRRFTINLRRSLAALLEYRETELVQRVRVSFAKVAEFQRRGLVHFHAIIRLDGPGPGWVAPLVDVSLARLQDAVRDAIDRTRLVVGASHREALALRWGGENDVKPIGAGADLSENQLTPETVAAYVSKYAIKGSEDFGIGGRPLAGDEARRRGLSEHVARMIDTADELARSVQGLQRLTRWTHMLGFRGHFASKSRRFSVTLGSLRRARASYRRCQDLELRGVVREACHDDDDEETTLLVGEWRFVGVGYTTKGDAALAAASAAYAREWREAMGARRT
jgi:hypothetical protein